VYLSSRAIHLVVFVHHFSDHFVLCCVFVRNDRFEYHTYMYLPLIVDDWAVFD